MASLDHKSSTHPGRLAHICKLVRCHTIIYEQLLIELAKQNWLIEPHGNMMIMVVVVVDDNGWLLLWMIIIIIIFIIIIIIIIIIMMVVAMVVVVVVVVVVMVDDDGGWWSWCCWRQRWRWLRFQCRWHSGYVSSSYGKDGEFDLVTGTNSQLSALWSFWQQI